MSGLAPTKREILTAICENPGWAPPMPVATSVQLAIDELRAEGWIIDRLDGHEATPRALAEYPDFYVQEDIRGPHASEPKRSPPVQAYPADTVSIVRVAKMLSVLAQQTPMKQMLALIDESKKPWEPGSPLEQDLAIRMAQELMMR